MKTKRLTPMFAATVLAIAGCASSGVSEKERAAFLADKPTHLHSVFLPIISEPEKDRVTHQLRAALAAMDGGYNNLAAKTFDDALLTIEAIYGDDPKARKARGQYNAESDKVFRGEPYERAMAYDYRGILYLMEDDYEHARASFKSGFLQDSLAGKERYRGDFSLLSFLDGWASQCKGDSGLGRESYRLAKESNSDLVIPDPRHNTLVLADLGHAPVKYTEGEHNEYLKFKSQDQISTPETNAATSWQNGVAGASRRLPNSESIAWQATTRGGREFDRILANKAEYKETAQTMSDVAAGVSVAASVTSIALSDYDDALDSAGLGLASGLFSIFAQSASDSTKPEADTRRWVNLPEKVAYGTFEVNEVSAPTVNFNAGVPARKVNFTTSGGSCEVVWSRSRAAN